MPPRHFAFRAKSLRGQLVTCVKTILKKADAGLAYIENCAHLWKISNSPLVMSLFLSCPLIFFFPDLNYQLRTNLKRSVKSHLKRPQKIFDYLETKANSNDTGGISFDRLKDLSGAYLVHPGLFNIFALFTRNIERLGV